MLNKFFVSQSEQSASPGPVHSIVEPATNNKVHDIEFTAYEVPAFLSRLDPTKSPGDDGIPTRILRTFARDVAPQVFDLFQQTIKYGRLPQEWKQATVTPIFKKGDRSLVSNYRPISFLSVLSKVLERIVYRRLYAHVEPFLPIGQSGFRKNYGTMLQLTRIVQTIAAAINDKNVVASCYFDLSKAFDRVWYDGLLAKLAHIGIGGSLLAWFKDYLNGRKPRVHVESATSCWQLILAGVPQGSILGPLLFLIYTYDLPATIPKPVLCNQFADDTGLCSIAQSQKKCS